MSLPTLPDAAMGDLTSGPSAVTGEPTAEPLASSPTNWPSTKPAQSATFRGGNKGNMKAPKATAPRARDTRLPTVRTGSVFERLYKTHTAASRAMTVARSDARRSGHFSTSNNNNNNNNHKKRTPLKLSKASVDESMQIFQRLHITGTVANTSKRLTPKSSTRYTPEVKKRTPKKAIPSTRTPMKTPSREPNVAYVYSPRMKPLTTLYFDSKYHPGLGRERIDPLKLGYNFFQIFCEYENGVITSEQLARELIIAFFKKDFPSGR